MPPLTEEEVYIFALFNMLHRQREDRQKTVQFSEILSLFTLYGVPDYETEAYTRLIIALDSTWHHYISKQPKPKSE